jgi:hypothetical protein
MKAGRVDGVHHPEFNQEPVRTGRDRLGKRVAAGGRTIDGQDAMAERGEHSGRRAAGGSCADDETSVAMQASKVT